MRTPVRSFTAAILGVFALCVVPAVASANSGCGAPTSNLGVSRIVEIDTSGGPLFGDITKFAKEERFLAPREVVLTFDDGPMPWITKSILDTLDRYCAKATFFSVGRMALAYPATVRDVLARGHTLGGHTHTHPLNIARLKSERSIDEIERGFAAIALAAGQPIAPFFRFPGLSDSPGLLDHLQKRGIASFTVDVVSDDSFINDAGRLARQTLARIEAKQGGIVLFHDIKASTAKALPVILGELRARGYKIVHMRPKAALVPVAHYEAELLPRLAKTQPRTDGKSALMPFFGTTGPRSANGPGTSDEASVATPTPAPMSKGGAQSDALITAAAAGSAVTVIAPAPRQRLASVASAAKPQLSSTKPGVRKVRRGTIGTAETGAAVGGWATEVRPTRLRPATN